MRKPTPASLLANFLFGGLLACLFHGRTDVQAGKKITAGHRPKTDQKGGMAVYLLNSPDIKPTRAREIELYLALLFFVCVKL